MPLTHWTVKIVQQVCSIHSAPNFLRERCPKHEANIQGNKYAAECAWPGCILLARLNMSCKAIRIQHMFAASENVASLGTLCT